MKDAQALLAAGRNAAAITYAIYSLEIYLKVRICDRLNLGKLPIAFQVHELEDLMILAGFSTRLDSSMMQGTKVRKNWDSIRDRSGKLTELRYGPDTTPSVDASDVLDQLNDPQDGVLSWLQKQP